MISRSEFEVLSAIYNSQELDHKKYQQELFSLDKENLLYKTSLIGDFKITQTGVRAYEEYIDYLKNNERISKADKRSSAAFIISIVLPIASILAAILIGVLT